jgi:hypothetical protein
MIQVPKFLATGIGSVPFRNPEEAVRLILSSLPEAPHWPQMPRLGFLEQMEVQYSEFLPCAVFASEKNRLYFDTAGDYSRPLPNSTRPTCWPWIGRGNRATAPERP